MAPDPESRSRIRVGLVGAGFVARAHTLAFASLAPILGRQGPVIVRQRIADIDATRARDAADGLGWRSWTTDWRSVVEADDIDIVDIVTPNDSHAEIAIAAAQAGKGVLCEKPLASKPTQARAMCAAVRDARVLNVVAFVYRNWPAMGLAKQIIEEERLGTITRFRGAFLHDWAVDPDVPLTWRLSRAHAGAGALGDVGSHLIDLARFLVGDVSRLLARSRTLIPERRVVGGDGRGPVDVDDLTDLLIEFDGGATGSLELNWVSCGSKTDIRFEVVGTRGAIRFSWDRPWELGFYSDGDPPHLRGFRQVVVGPEHPGSDLFWPVAGHGVGWADAFTILLCRAFALEPHAHELPTFHDGVAVSEIVDAAQRSVVAGKWIDLRDTPSASMSSG